MDYLLSTQQQTDPSTPHYLLYLLSTTTKPYYIYTTTNGPIDILIEVVERGTPLSGEEGVEGLPQLGAVSPRNVL